MKLRVFVGVLMAIAFLVVNYVDWKSGAFAWGISVMYVAGMTWAMKEFLGLYEAGGTRTYPVLFVAALTGLIATAQILEIWKHRPLGPGGTSLPEALTILVLILFLCYEVIRGEPERFRNVAILILAFFYVIVLGSFSMKIRHLPACGAAYFLWYVVVGKGTDAMAYFTGKAIGRTKLIPKVSPGKTIEGGIGGLVLGMGMGLIVWHFTHLHEFFPLWLFIPLSLAVQVVGQFGDLVESLLKRHVAQKDSAKLLPGMGGVLDVIDCLLLSAPVAYYGALAASMMKARF